MNAYGKLCTEFYDADKQLADGDELQLYQELFSTEELILEPMCGSGRLLIPLLQLGYDIEGFDNSTHMLEKFGFKHIRKIKRFLNGSDHMTFIATVEKN